MRKHLHFLLVFLMPFLLFGQTWEQIGQDIYGESANIVFGGSVSMNSDGSIVAVGAQNRVDPINPGNNQAGAVYVYQYNGTSWEQMGQTLYGSSQTEYFGASTSLSADGKTMAVGAYGASNNRGAVKIYHFDGTSWVQEAVLDGSSGTKFGSAISLSPDGTILAATAPSFSIDTTTPNLYRGAAYVFRHNGTEWSQLGEKVIGEYPKEYFGTSVAISSDGSKMIVGAESYTGEGYTAKAGKAFIYQYNADGNTWELLGNQDILHGELGADQLFGHSVSINTNGTIVAVGAYGTNANNGRAYIFKYSGTSWESSGQIDGVDAGGWTGHRVILNGTGNIIAVVSPRADVDGIVKAGALDIYKYNSTSWEQLGNRISGRMANDGLNNFSGLGISSDGDKLAFGLPAADKPGTGGTNLGLLRMFKYVVAPASVTVSTENNVEPKVSIGEALQLEAAVLPDGANQGVVWSVESGNTYASVDENGLVTGIASGTAVVRATSAENSSLYGEIEITVSETLSVSESGSKDFTWYPNPVYNILNISSQKDIRSVQIYDPSGRMVFTQGGSKAGISKLDISTLKIGTYLVKIETDKGAKTFKIIKK